MSAVATQAQDRGRGAHQPRRSSGRLADEVATRVAQQRQTRRRPLRCPPGRRSRNRRRVRVRIEQGGGELRARNAVDGGVVHLGDHSDHAALEPFGDMHLPQRTRPLQRPADHLGGELRQLGRAARGPQHGGPNVVIEVEVGIFDPHRSMQMTGHRYQPTPKRRHQMQAFVDPPPHRGEREVPRRRVRVEHTRHRDLHRGRRRVQVHERAVQTFQSLHGSTLQAREADPSQRFQPRRSSGTRNGIRRGLPPQGVHQPAGAE